MKDKTTKRMVGRALAYAARRVDRKRVASLVFAVNMNKSSKSAAWLNASTCPAPHTIANTIPPSNARTDARTHAHTLTHTPQHTHTHARTRAPERASSTPPHCYSLHPSSPLRHTISRRHQRAHIERARVRAISAAQNSLEVLPSQKVHSLF